MFPNGCNIKWTQLQYKHGICLKLGALGKYFQFISMNKSIANWNYLFAGIKHGLVQQFASTSSQSYSHSNDRFFKKKKKKKIMNKTSSLLIHLHLHLLHFLIMNKSSNLKKRKKKDFHIFQKKKKRERIFKKPWD